MTGETLFGDFTNAVEGVSTMNAQSTAWAVL